MISRIVSIRSILIFPHPDIGGILHFNTRQEISESDGTLRYVRLRHTEDRMKTVDKSLSCTGITKAVYHAEDCKEE